MLKAERKWIDWMIRQKNILLFLIVTCLAILARVGGLSFVSADMNDYLLPWPSNSGQIPAFPLCAARLATTIFCIRRSLS